MPTIRPVEPATLAAQITALLAHAAHDPSLPCPDMVELAVGPGHTSGTPLIDFDLASDLASDQVAAWGRVEQDGLLDRFETGPEDYGAAANLRLHLLASGVAARPTGL